MPKATEREPGDGASILPFPKLPAPAAEQPPADARSTGLRDVLGDVLRDERRRQDRTLADVADDAAVSVGYLSEIERGRKDVSSDVLDAVTRALEVPLSTVLDRCAERLRVGPQRGSSIRLLAA